MRWPSCVTLVLIAVIENVSASEKQIFTPSVNGLPTIVAATYSSEEASCPAMMSTSAVFVLDNQTDTLWLIESNRRIAYAITEDSVKALRDKEDDFIRSLTKLSAEYADRLPDARSGGSMAWKRPPALVSDSDKRSLVESRGATGVGSLDALVESVEKYRNILSKDLILGGLFQKLFSCSYPIGKPPYTVESTSRSPKTRVFSERPVDADGLKTWKGYARRKLADSFPFAGDQQETRFP